MKSSSYSLAYSPAQIIYLQQKPSIIQYLKTRKYHSRGESWVSPLTYPGIRPKIQLLMKPRSTSCSWTQYPHPLKASVEFSTFLKILFLEARVIYCNESVTHSSTQSCVIFCNKSVTLINYLIVLYAELARWSVNAVRTNLTCI